MPLHSCDHPKRTLDNASEHFGPDLRLFIKDVADRHCRKRPIKVKTWSTIKDVKDALQKQLGVPQSAQLLYFGPLMASGLPLPNHRTLTDAGVYRSGETLLLKIKGDRTSAITKLKSEGVSDVCISPSLLDITPKDLLKTIRAARCGLTLGYKPDLVPDGSGGTYFLRNARRVPVAVFKPADEEPYAENNPRGYVRAVGVVDKEEEESLMMREGIQPGEACLREVAAFLLDHHGLSGIPMTTLAEAQHPTFCYNGSLLNRNEGGGAVGRHSLQFGSSLPENLPSKKVGSWQEFVSTECSMDDLSPSKLSVHEVHKIAILDIRIMNADRNPANLLCRRNREGADRLELVPIDHGYCLRSVADVCWFDWCWLDWPQLKLPVSKQMRKYILSLDIEDDVRMLHDRLRLPQKALDYFRASSKLLQEGVKKGLTLYDIAILCCRNDNTGEKPSPLEVLMATATDVASSAIHNGRWHHAAASRALEHQLSPGNNNRKTPIRNSVPVPKSNMLKSASSVNMSSYPSDTIRKTATKPLLKSSMKPSLKSSATKDQITPTPSTTSGEYGCEEWAREEWAASVVIKFDASPIPTPSRRRQRSTSVISVSSHDSHDSSNTSDSSTDGGFWVRAPSSTHGRAEDDYLWTPDGSPRMTPVEGRSVAEPQISIKTCIAVKFDVASKVEEEVKDMEPFELAPGADMTSPGMTCITGPVAGPSLLKRSQSYSGRSLEKMVVHGVSEKNVGEKYGRETSNEKYRVYLLKFIDLLVTREVTIKARQQMCE